jgi:hypothetical protein
VGSKSIVAMNRLVLGFLLALSIGSGSVSAQSGPSAQEVEDIFMAASDLSAAEVARSYYVDGVWENALSAGRQGCDSTFDIKPVARADACSIVGRVLAEGRVGPPDNAGALAAHQKAAALYKQLCSANNMRANDCMRAGAFFESAYIDVRDEAAARRLYAKSCDANHYGACLNLGNLWRDGRGGEENHATAMELYLKACGLNPLYGCSDAGTLMISSPNLPPDPTRGRSLQKKGCDAGSSSACISYAKTLRDGIGGATDTTLARSLLENHCTDDHIEYCLEPIADMWWSGIGGEPQRSDAETLMRAACVEYELVMACDWLRGKGLPVD